MTRKTVLVVAFVCGALFGASVLHHRQLVFAEQQPSAPSAHKPIKIVHFYTGVDHQTHFDEIEAAPENGVFKLQPVNAAEVHHGAPGSVTKWHTAPQRQYVITLSGHGEIEASDGKKVEVGPGSVEFAEDLTGKGHITRVIGDEDRLTLWLPLTDQTPPSIPAH